MKIRDAMTTIVEVVNDGKKKHAMDGCLAMDLKHFEVGVQPLSILSRTSFFSLLLKGFEAVYSTKLKRLTII